MHMWWGWRKVKHFWNEVRNTSWEILGKKFVNSSRIMLLCDFDGNNIGSSCVLLVNLLAAATMLIASRWKSMEIPSVEEWLDKIHFFGLMS